MPVIYFDNFRGFTKTFLPLKDVNFFVGENSSGKTSVLKLIKVLSDSRFWFNNEFSSEDAELGYFSEIVSHTDPSKKFFEIGILSDHDENSDGLIAIKIKFYSKEGIPAISEIRLLIDGINFQAVFMAKGLKYRMNTVQINDQNPFQRLEFFKSWISNSQLSAKRFRVDNESEYLFDNKLPLIFAFQTIISKHLSAKAKKKRHIFLMPNFLQDIAWMAPIRTDPKRTYDSYKTSFNPDGTHAPYLLKKLLGDSTKEERDKVKSILKKFGSDSGLFDNIEIKSLGKSDTSPFELQVLLHNQPLKITNVGYGVSQVLPLVIEIIARQSGTWFAIQQPEIHLHPRGQAAFGDFVYKSAKNDNQKFIIETHSDYTIDRFRLKLSRDRIENVDLADQIKSQIVFFSRKSGRNKLTCIPILSNGNLSEDQPSEFKEFFIKEQLDILTM